MSKPVKLDPLMDGWRPSIPIWGTKRIQSSIKDLITHEIPWIIEEIIVRWINLRLARKDRCLLGICRIYFRTLYHEIIFMIFNIYTLRIFLYIFFTYMSGMTTTTLPYWGTLTLRRMLAPEKNKAIDCLFLTKVFSIHIPESYTHIYCNVC